LSTSDYCPECGKIATSHVVDRIEDYLVAGVVAVLVDAKVRVCDDCDADRSDNVLDAGTLDSAYEKAGWDPESRTFGGE